MKFKSALIFFTSALGISSLSFSVHSSTEYIQIKKENKIIADLVKVNDLNKLQLVLKNQQDVPYKKFATIQKQNRHCQLSFAMNAGMYHADFSSVGLYIEHSKLLHNLNLERNKFGNFFMQPNGVVAWNKNTAIIKTTDQYQKSGFKAEYATQSGPMLVIGGLINPIFEKNSDSLKVRNGVGIKNNQLYFVISRGRISFYDFADIFKSQLKIDQALYLDGSISSAYIPQAKRNDQIYELGPMFIYDEAQSCMK